MALACSPGTATIVAPTLLWHLHSEVTRVSLGAVFAKQSSFPKGNVGRVNWQSARVHNPGIHDYNNQYTGNLSKFQVAILTNVSRKYKRDINSVHCVAIGAARCAFLKGW